ncbi:hypothetical protein BTM381_20350 [Helicobacter pylori]
MCFKNKKIYHTPQTESKNPTLKSNLGSNAIAIQHAKIKSLKLKSLTPKKHAKNPNKPIKNALKKEGKKSNSNKYPSKKTHTKTPIS